MARHRAAGSPSAGALSSVWGIRSELVMEIGKERKEIDISHSDANGDR